MSKEDIQTARLQRWLLYLLNVTVICCVIYVLTRTAYTYIKIFSLPTSEIISSIADDEFYVLQVAKNFAQGNGVTFDGTAPTTGFHPLYFLFLSLIYVIGNPDVVTFLMSSIVLKTLFYLFSAILIFIIVKKLSFNHFYRKQLGVIISLIFIAHPYMLFLIFSGLEQLILIFFFLCFLLCYININITDKKKSGRSFVFCGILLGLTYLSRTDIIIILPFILLLIIFLQRKNLKNAVLFALGFLAIIIPWYIFIHFNTGSLAQDSGAVKMFLNESINLPLAKRFLSSWAFINKFWWPFLHHELSYLYKLFWGLLFIAGVSLILNNISIRKHRKWLTNNLTLTSDTPLLLKINIQVVVICIFYSILIAITYGFLFSSAREWYYGLSIVAISLTLFISINFLFLFIKNQTLSVFSILMIVLFSIFVFSGMVSDQNFHLGKYKNQKEMMVVSKWMKQNLPKTAIIGSWNSGIFGYFSERKVINLDGLINNDILKYLKSNSLYNYMKKRKINYIIDYTVMLYWQEKYFGKSLKEISLAQDTTFSGTWQLSDISVWRITY